MMNAPVAAETTATPLLQTLFGVAVGTSRRYAIHQV
jgi:hypothetical protein